MSVDTVTAPAFDAFKNLLWDSFVKATLFKLFTAVPLLGWGPFGMIITFFVSKYSNQLYEAVKYMINVELIVLKNYEAKKSYDIARIKLSILYHSKGQDSQEFKDAREIHKNILSNFVSWDHSS